MDLRTVKVLLAKYEQGETTIAEEKALKEFFRNEDVPAELQHEKMMFGFFDDAQNEGTEKIYHDIPNENNITISATKRTFSFRTRYGKISAMAAALVLLIGIGIILKQDAGFGNKNKYGTYNDPKIAYAQTKNALMLISGKLNKGSRNLTKLSKLYEAQTLVTAKKQ